VRKYRGEAHVGVDDRGAARLRLDEGGLEERSGAGSRPSKICTTGRPLLRKIENFYRS